MNAITLDPTLVERLLTSLDPATPGVYTIVRFPRHLLSGSTVLDNCRATYLVNDVERLVPGSLTKAEPEDCV